MAAKNIEFTVGAVVLLGLLILFGSLYWLQVYRVEKNAMRLVARFTDVGTLSAGDRVTVSGVHVGKVDGLRLVPNGVLVQIVLERKIPLSADARFEIKNMGLMGERFIAITPGTDTILLDPTKTIVGEFDTGLPEVMGLMGEMVVELRGLVASLKRTVASDSSLARFDRTVANLEDVSSSLSSYVQRNESKLDQAADNFLSASSRLNQVIADNATRVDSSATRVDRMTSDLSALVQRLDSVSLSAKRMASLIDTGQGTLQLLLEDRQLYDNLRKTADNIDDLVTDIRTHPGRYINVKVSLF